MIIKDMTITNSRGDSIIFGRHFKLSKDFDLSGLKARVNYSESTADGSNYQNTKIDNRDFDIPFYIDKSIKDVWWIEEQRNLAFKVFNPKSNPFRIDITTKNGSEYYLIANLEGAPSFPTGFNNNNKSWQKGILQFSSNDPYFYSKNEEKVDIALWVGNFEFPLEITEDGIEMGYREPSLIVNVYNDGQESTGMLIRFRALGTLINPSLVNVNTYDSLKINTTMLPGDIIEVSTYKRRKRVTLIRSGISSNIFNLLDLPSKFLQLEIGDNLFRYDAEEGLDNLEVSMTFTPRLLGV
ncbi:phage tail family protein [Anaerobacillus isosaccharinicus]|uniref:Phage tail family protein n=1 Tax=Anaerobacillus isosaccharinicus TaxID=1532552 RepID=A0A1S2L954_9BACI|nr:phage tail family protein [Anaerobacillus isosaccharinicus]MBA5584580.1 phage tail family protein [Anaerobacillus isosaccharinicus]QOY37040.1 phage tail family protein [Anaerobacillus isosaccharinicus]